MTKEFLLKHQCRECLSTWYKGDLTGGLCDSCRGVAQNDAQKRDKHITQDRLDHLKKAFDLVVDPHDWRGFICAVSLVEDRDRVGVTVEEIAEAIWYYTASKAKVTVLKMPTGAVLFQADGYREV